MAWLSTAPGTAPAIRSCVGIERQTPAMWAAAGQPVVLRAAATLPSGQGAVLQCQ